MGKSDWSSSGVFVSPKLPKNPAVGYSTPDLRRVAVEIKAEDDDFLPFYESGANEANLMANIPSGQLKLPKGSCLVIDCGISLDIPSGYKCVVSGRPGLFLYLLDDKRIKVYATNLDENLILFHKQVIGKIWVEPVYFFEWLTKG